jgi:hypothetical protein
MVPLPDAAGQVRNVDAVKDSQDSKDGQDSQGAQDTRDAQDINGIGDFREMSVRALRGLFSGIGQLLLAADRFRAREAQREGVDHVRASNRSTSRTRTPSASRTRHKATPPAQLPIPGYDELSLASLRARLRYLDAKQLRILLEHEKSASNRAAVVTMFERRIAKIESGTDAT